ncbi:MAG TPA: hypothetical protein VGX96_17380 [Candidatus Elarobacter sp.]|jgi:hypothetical protein|nr:hypothetical protein [Candidatus Elarobacter sp.]
MEALSGPEKIIAAIGALIVGYFAIVSLRGEWHKTGLDDQVTKVLLGLMALGCVLVLFAAAGVLPRPGGGPA